MPHVKGLHTVLVALVSAPRNTAVLLMGLWSMKSLQAFLPTPPAKTLSHGGQSSRPGVRALQAPPEPIGQPGIAPSLPLTLLMRVWGSRAALGEACVCVPRAKQLHRGHTVLAHVLVSIICFHSEQLVLPVHWPQAVAVACAIGPLGD